MPKSDKSSKGWLQGVTGSGRAGVNRVGTTSPGVRVSASPEFSPGAGVRRVPGPPRGAGRRGSGGSRGLPRGGVGRVPAPPHPPCWLSARASSCIMTGSMTPASEVPQGRLAFSPRPRGCLATEKGGAYGSAAGPELSGGEALRRPRGERASSPSERT